LFSSYGEAIMKVVLLAGGLGTRLAEETEVKPKPMVEIGGRPILWHIMKHYGHHGFCEFFIALGYRGQIIKRYFLEYFDLDGSMSVDLRTGQTRPHHKRSEPWQVHLMETGLHAKTGDRVRALRDHLADQTFMLTYGDGVSDVDLAALLATHRRSGALATITAVRPPARFGGLILDGEKVCDFTEKPQIGSGWINGGFIVCEPDVLPMLEGDDVSFERAVLEPLAEQGKLAAYQHEGFWQCMDNLRDVRTLETLWQSGSPPWKLWHD
jgi:glucose-1-phosphate cytidylyltransferase